ncbi:MAG: tRNA (adenosine(37)-N6)-dimethylallyltransferase MiaA [Pseudomonadales bacterium]|nr:tRNA (adenosine(37)-N6)-dimethylallyltransferase MiaA [Pseudomonadales bacterium]
MAALTPAIFLMGPTASGKTALAMQLADRLPVEIISVDSALVYRDMNIGTAKPDQETLARYPHHLVDIRDPDQPYSAADFRADVLPLITDIQSRNRIPLLVGGTMLYFRALREGLAELPAADPEIRARIAGFAQAEGWPAVHARLQAVDPASAQRIHPNDPQRLQRALEIFEVSGKTMTEWHQQQVVSQLPFDVVDIAVMPPDRTHLHALIAQRFKQMLTAGFVEEVQSLRQKYQLHPDLPSVKSVGYRQVWQFLENAVSYDEMVFQGIVATRQLAKRQYTWLRSWQNLHRLDSPDVAQTLKILQSNIILAKVLQAAGI